MEEVGEKTELEEEEVKTLQVIQGYNLRQIIDKANSLGITKEDIVQIFSIEDSINLVYFK